MKSSGIANQFGFLWGDRAVPVSEAFGSVAKDGQCLRDRIQRWSYKLFFEGIKTFGFRWRLGGYYDRLR